MDLEFHGQAEQDKFVLSVLKNKTNGYFLEIGSNDPIYINNSYILEKKYGWNGLMVEYDGNFERYYRLYRSSHYIIQDATKIDYANFFEKNQFPKNMDYLQIDLEAWNGSTINTLKLLDETIFDEYKFAVVTFEHDIYRGDHFDTRNTSREIFKKRGYHRVYSDVANGTPYEDWYVYPPLVDMDYIEKIQRNESLEWREIMKIIDNV